MLGAGVAFLTAGAFVNGTTGLFQHNMFVGRACAALNLAHNPLHEDQLLGADALREIVAAIELVQNRRRSRDIVRPRSVRGITPKTRMGSSPSEDCGGLAGGGSTADPRSAGAMHVARTAVEAIATALLHGGTPAFLALEALVHAAAVLLRHAHVGRARVVPEPRPHRSARALPPPLGRRSRPHMRGGSATGTACSDAGPHDSNGECSYKQCGDQRQTHVLLRRRRLKLRRPGAAPASRLWHMLPLTHRNCTCWKSALWLALQRRCARCWGRLVWRQQALAHHCAPSGDRGRAICFTSDVACSRFACGGEAAFFAVNVFVDMITALIQHTSVSRARVAQDLALNPIHEGQLLGANGLREIVATTELVHSRGRVMSKGCLKSRQLGRGTAPLRRVCSVVMTRIGSSPSEDCGGLPGGGRTADPRNTGAMHVARAAADAIERSSSATGTGGGDVRPSDDNGVCSRQQCDD